MVPYEFAGSGAGSDRGSVGGVAAEETFETCVLLSMNCFFVLNRPQGRNRVHEARDPEENQSYWGATEGKSAN